MFPNRFFARRMFAPRFFPRRSAAVIPPVVQQAGGDVRHLRYVKPLYEFRDLERLRRQREDEEIIIL